MTNPNEKKVGADWLNSQEKYERMKELLTELRPGLVPEMERIRGIREEAKKENTK